MSHVTIYDVIIFRIIMERRGVEAGEAMIEDVGGDSADSWENIFDIQSICHTACK